MSTNPSTRQRTLVAAVLMASACTLTAVFGGEATSLRGQFLAADASQAADASATVPVMSRGAMESIASAFER